MRRLSILVVVIGTTLVLCAGCGSSSGHVSVRAQSAQGLQSGQSGQFEFTTYWVRGFDDPRPVDSYAFHDTPGAHPYVAFGSVTNVGDTTAHDIGVSVSWVTKGGNAVHTATATATVLRPSATADLDKGPMTDRSGRLPRSAQPVSLGPGASADVLVVVQPDATTSGIDALAPSWHAVAS